MSHVYLMRYGHIYKIGYSISPERRRKQLRPVMRGVLRDEVAPDTPLIILHTVVVADGEGHVENVLHARFDACAWRAPHQTPAQQTEYFKLTDDDVAWFLSLTSETIVVMAHTPRTSTSTDTASLVHTQAEYLDRNEWLDQKDAAIVSGYNSRSLRNMANAGKVTAMKGLLHRGIHGAIPAWHFRRSDMERLAAARRSSELQ